MKTMYPFHGCILGCQLTVELFLTWSDLFAIYSYSSYTFLGASWIFCLWVLSTYTKEVGNVKLKVFFWKLHILTINQNWMLCRLMSLNIFRMQKVSLWIFIWLRRETWFFDFQWLKVGEENTKFFHCFLAEKKRKMLISDFCSSDGCFILFV